MKHAQAHRDRSRAGGGGAGAGCAVSQDPTYATAYVAGTRRSFVLLITDGMETCDSDSMTRNNIMALFTKGYPTYVVGFGGGEDPAALNMFATVGAAPAEPAQPDRRVRSGSRAAWSSSSSGDVGSNSYHVQPGHLVQDV